MSRNKKFLEDRSSNVKTFGSGMTDLACTDAKARSRKLLPHLERP
jgi:hypothetical protein